MGPLLDYVWNVLFGWQSLALAALGLNELSEWLLKRSIKWLHSYRWRAAVLFLLISQAVVYYQRPAVTTQAPPSPVIAENPDHTGLVDRLESVKKELSKVEKERDGEKAAREKAEQRARDLEGQLGAVARRETRCDSLATLSATGRQLVTKLRATRAAPDTRREIDKWYEAVCSAVSKKQCEAFLAAPRKSDGWVNYPSEDGG